MLNFLFHRKGKNQPKARSATSQKTNDTVNDATVNSHRTPENCYKHSIALEDGHYGYILDVDELTSEKLSTTEEDFVRSINKLVKSSNSLSDEIPRLPDLLPKLLKLLRSDDASWQSVVDIIVQDSVLVAGVIKVANSPFYRLNVDAKNLEQVVVHLGQKGVREVVMSVAFKPIMQFKGNKALKLSSKKMWDHALKSAVASRSIADHYGANSFDAYLAGLVHNVGMNIILKKFSVAPELIEIPQSLVFKNHMEKLSSLLSTKIVKDWGMPQIVVDAVTDQNSVRSNNQRSWIGDILLQGRSVSMKHSLMTDSQWRTLLEPEVDLESLLQDSPCELAYAELNNFEL